MRGGRDFFSLFVTLYGLVMIGTTLSRYDVLEELGQGGMSVVYLAQDTALSRKVALKLLHRHLAKKLDNQKRFRREAEAIARLRHPNILDVYDVSDESDERSFIVMEYIPGSNLRQFVDRNGPPPPEVAALIGVDICNALAHAHKHGVIHRDLKPENVMVSGDGQIKLMDFGIAHVIDAETMTKTGSLMGSPAHMAPELIDGKKIDERVDVFALGTVLYWMSTGKLPFCGDNAPQVLRNVMECRYKEPEVVEPRIGHDLARIICKSLSKDPDDRFASVETVKRELLAAVHSVGVEETESVLRDYFADPKAFGEAYADQIVPKLIARGKRAMERKNIPSAIALFNRVLAYDPGNEEVRECLAQLNRNRQTVRAAAVLAVLLVVAAGGWAVVATSDEETVDVPGDEVSRQRVENAVSIARSQARATAEARAGVGSARSEAQQLLVREQGRWTGLQVAAMAEGIVDEKANGRRKVTRLEVPRRAQVVHAPPITTAKTASDASDATEQPVEQVEQVERFPVGFKIFPASARLEVNGEKVYWQTDTIELPQGRHEVKVTAPGCKPYSEILVVNGPRTGKNKIPLVLDWRQATIKVVSNKDVLVYVGNERDPRSNGRRSTISVPFERKMIDPKKTVLLRIADASNLRRTDEREVVIAAGTTQTVKVNFH